MTTSKKQLLERIEELEADRDNLAQRVLALEGRPYMPPFRPYMPPYYPQPPYWTPTVTYGESTACPPPPSGVTVSCGASE